MKQFDFKRFWLVLQNDFFCIKDLYLGFVVASLSFLVLSIVFHSVPGMEDNNWISVFQLICIILLAVFPIISPLQLRNMSSNQRCVLLLQPASNVEKFVSKFALVWFLPIAFSCATYFLMPHSYGLFARIDDSLWVNSRFWIFSVIAVSGMHTLASMVISGKTIGRITGVMLFAIFLIAEILPSFSNVLNDGVTQPFFPLNLAKWIMQDNSRITVFQIVLTLLVLTICTIFSYKRFKRLTITQ